MSYDNFTPLTLAIEYDENEIALTLIEKRCDTNVLSIGNWSPLMIIIYKNIPDFAEKLIDAECELNHKNYEDGLTALHLSIQCH